MCLLKEFGCNSLCQDRTSVRFAGRIFYCKIEETLYASIAFSRPLSPLKSDFAVSHSPKVWAEMSSRETKDKTTISGF